MAKIQYGAKCVGLCVGRTKLAAFHRVSVSWHGSTKSQSYSTKLDLESVDTVQRSIPNVVAIPNVMHSSGVQDSCTTQHRRTSGTSFLQSGANSRVDKTSSTDGHLAVSHLSSPGCLCGRSHQLVVVHRASTQQSRLAPKPFAWLGDARSILPRGSTTGCSFA